MIQAAYVSGPLEALICLCLKQRVSTDQIKVHVLHAVALISRQY